MLRGFTMMTEANVLLLFRIQVEENLLIEAFGEEYLEYRKRTKKLLPHIYW